MCGHLFASGGEVCDVELVVESFEEILSFRCESGGLATDQVEGPVAGQVEQAACVGDSTEQECEGQRGLQEEASFQYLDLCRLSWFIQMKKPLISEK